IYPPFLPEDRAQLIAFLASRGLGWEGDPDYTVAVLRRGRLVGAGSLSGRIVKGLAVDEGLAGEGLAARILSELEAEAARRGFVQPFVFTSPNNRAVFEAMGYRLVGQAPGSAMLLEKGDGIDRWSANLSALAAVERAGRAASAKAAGEGPSEAGAASALVMNCNPFTLGHLHLVRTACAASSLVFLLVVSEEASAFPYATRLRLVREGTAGIPNLAVVPGSDYLVSRATFPTYFLKDKAGEAAAIHARLDVDIFGSRIAPALGVTRRFVGEEPYSEVTALYNCAMKEWLPSYGVEVVEIPRLADGSGAAVSASTVRALIRGGRIGEVRAIVPETTWNYLVSEEAAPVLARLAASDGRH
ncbi:[citrate (pro-3S)-lyase] ligase, partial [bacterium]|nr:[citrate (pro-3S)-lyase] ligase [bacterium]